MIAWISRQLSLSLRRNRGPKIRLGPNLGPTNQVTNRVSIPRMGPRMGARIGSGSDISAPAVNLLNENPTLVALGKKYHKSVPLYLLGLLKVLINIEAHKACLYTY